MGFLDRFTRTRDKPLTRGPWSKNESLPALTHPETYHVSLYDYVGHEIPSNARITSVYIENDSTVDLRLVEESDPVHADDARKYDYPKGTINISLKTTGQDLPADTVTLYIDIDVI